jgi:hypothetical protein
MTEPNSERCHGVFECLQAGSRPWALSWILKPWQKVHSYVVWHLENLGCSEGLKCLCKGGLHGQQVAPQGPSRGDLPATDETLNLRPGEWVRVRSVEEILATLDGNRRHRGLRWMTGMRQYCGQRFRVYKPVERIMLETNGQLRKMKNTVLLEGVTCDGVEFGACDRSCYHFWREAWLQRVENPGPDEGDPSSR